MCGFRKFLTNFENILPLFIAQSAKKRDTFFGPSSVYYTNPRLIHELFIDGIFTDTAYYCGVELGVLGGGGENFPLSPRQGGIRNGEKLVIFDNFFEGNWPMASYTFLFDFMGCVYE